MMAFGKSKGPLLPGGLSQADIEEAFPNWRIDHVEPASVDGMPKPIQAAKPNFYRLVRACTQASPPADSARLLPTKRPRIEPTEDALENQRFSSGQHCHRHYADNRNVRLSACPRKLGHAYAAV